jgi:uncharacterized membrane protein YfcA
MITLETVRDGEFRVVVDEGTGRIEARRPAPAGPAFAACFSSLADPRRGTLPAMFDVWLPASGFIVGTLVGLTGVGGGALMTPLLILLFGVRPTLAVGSDLAYATITKLVGSIHYVRRGQVNFPYVRWLIVGSVPGSVFAVTALAPWLAGLGVNIERLTTHTLGGMLALIAVLSLAEPWLYAGRLRNSRIIRSRTVQVRFKEPILIVGGLFIGAGVGLTSVGSGSVLMAILLLVSELDLLVLIGTDIVHATILLAAAGAAHWAKGNVEPHLVLGLLLGSVPGVWVGSRVSQVVPRGPLRATLALILGATGVKLALV